MEKSSYDNLYKLKNQYPIGPLNIIRNELILKQVPKSPKKILDIGCGRGFLDIELAKLGHTIVGVDFSQTAVEFAKKLAEAEELSSKIQFLADNLFKLQMNEKFDVVICSEVVEHIEDDKSAVKKLNSFLKKDGILIITVPYSMRQWNKDDDRSGHFRRYYTKDMKKLLDGEKLKIEKMIVWGFPLMRSYRFIYRQTYKSSSEDEEVPLGYIPKGKIMKLYKILSPYIIKIFHLDNLLNFTRFGLDLLAVSRKVND